MRWVPSFVVDAGAGQALPDGIGIADGFAFIGNCNCGHGDSPWLLLKGPVATLRNIGRAPGTVSAQNLEQEFQNLNVPPGLREIFPPRVQSVPAQQKPMRAGVLVQDTFDSSGQAGHVLRVLDDWKPLRVLVCGYALEALQHFIPGYGDAAVPAISVRKKIAPY